MAVAVEFRDHREDDLVLDAGPMESLPLKGEIIWLTDQGDVGANGGVSAWRVVDVCHWVRKGYHRVCCYVEPVRQKEGLGR